MTRFQMVLMILIVPVFLTAPAFAVAQEIVTNTPAAPMATPTPVAPPVEAPEQPPADAPLTRTEIVLVGALFIVSALLSVFAASFVVFSKRLLEAAPPWIRELIRENAGRGLDELDRRARETPTVLDDELARQIREFVLKVLMEGPSARAGC